MKKLDGMTDEQVDAEIEEMNGENAVAGCFLKTIPRRYRRNSIKLGQFNEFIL
jgi:hypothetical protein